MPKRITNNAVASVTVGSKDYVVSFSGLGKGKTPADTLDVTYVLDMDLRSWKKMPPVPGDVGRLASVASAAGELIYVFGGYSVAADGTEVSTRWVHSFDPVSGTYQERKSMPVPVDDAVAASYQNRYIYLLSGWHNLGNVNLVQRYDSVSDTWSQATPIPGRAVFGHAGGIVGNTLMYCDGVAIETNKSKARDFVPNNECFLGTINTEDSRKIDWRRIDPHPGDARYRMAAAGIQSENAVLFIGGSENPYNFDGIGYDGEPSNPEKRAMLFDLDKLKWHIVKLKNRPSMDHRGLVQAGDRWLTIGGMLEGQSVTGRVTAYRFK
jgi:N-acetylneuraminic acid mutarotase